MFKSLEHRMLLFGIPAGARMITGGMVATGIAVAVIALTNAPWQLGMLLFVLGIFVTPVQAGVATLAQTPVPDALRGRANSALNTVISLAMVISQAFAGLLAAAVGIGAVFVIGGGLTVLAGVPAGILFFGQSTEAESVPVGDPAPEAV